MITLYKQVNLQPYSTFKLPAQAAYFCELNDTAQLLDICRLPEFKRDAALWLGGGSNILFMADYPGLVIKINNKGIQELSRKNGQVLIEVQAGEIWHDFVLYTLQSGLSGLENLSLIPGTVGASPVQNIGAYGVEVKDRIDSVYCFDLEKHEFIRLNNQDCRFSYRNSLFKQAGKSKYVIVSVVFKLDEQFIPNIHYGDLSSIINQQCQHRPPTAQDVSNAVCLIRRKKLPDPNQIGNVGSFYQNPIISAEQAKQLHTQYPDMPIYPQPDGTKKLAAAWLIDQCGLKGKRIGGAAVHKHQALVLINQNQATANDVRTLSDLICQTIWQKFGITLLPEPNMLP